MDRVQTSDSVWLARLPHPQFTKKTNWPILSLLWPLPLYTQLVKTPVNSTLERNVSTLSLCSLSHGHHSASQLSQMMNASFHQEAPVFLSSLHFNPSPMLPHFPRGKTSLVMPWWCVQTTAGSPVLKHEIQIPQLWVWILHHLASPTSVPNPDPPHPSSPVTPGALNSGICTHKLLGIYHALFWLMAPYTSERLHCLQRGCTNTLSITSTYLCNKVQEIHPRFGCFCVCQSEQRRQFKSYCIASIPSLKKTNQKKKYIYILLDRQSQKCNI